MFLLFLPTTHSKKLSSLAQMPFFENAREIECLLKIEFLVLQKNSYLVFNRTF